MTNTKLEQVISALPDGYSEVSYQDSRYGMSVKRFNQGKSIKVYADELKGTNFISLNYYVSSAGKQLKPCEMSREKVIHFLLNHKPLN